MRRFMLLVPLLAGCGVFGGDDTDDTTGAPPPNRNVPLSGNSDMEMYAERYNNVKATHNDLKITLSDRSVSPLRATSQLEEMRNDTKHMANLTAEPYSGQLLEIAERFDAARDRVRGGTWSQKTVADLDTTVRRFSSDFSPSRVVMRKNVLPDTSKPKDPDVRPVSTTPRDPALGTADPTSLKSAPWMFYKAWIQEHADLETAVGAGDDKAARIHYGRVIQLIKWMEESAEGDQKRRLAGYRAEYELTERKTTGFTVFSGDFTKERAVATMRAAGDSLKLNFDPDTTP